MRRRNRSDVEAKVRQALEMVRLPELSDRKPHQLSGGQQQRIALARALIAEPELVLMDEPLGALDKQLRDHMQLEIRSLHERLGGTVVYVTHDQGEALTMSDRVAVFQSGRIQQLATPREVYEHPANEFVASFIGESNRIPGILVGIADESCSVRLSDGSVVTCTPGDVAQKGEAAVVIIRPERVMLNPPNDAAIRLTGLVTGSVFFGDHVRVLVQHDRIGEFVVRVPNSGRNDVPQPGTETTFGWHQQGGIALKARP